MEKRVGRMSRSVQAELSREGLMRLARKMKIRLREGSIHMHVPVKPRCPMVEGCASGAVGEESGFFVSGASNPRPRRDMSLRAVMNSLTVGADISRSPPYVPPLSHI